MEKNTIKTLALWAHCRVLTLLRNCSNNLFVKRRLASGSIRLIKRFSAKDKSDNINDRFHDQSNGNKRPEYRSWGKGIGQNQGREHKGQNGADDCNKPIFLLGAEHINGPLNLVDAAEQCQYTINDRQERKCPLFILYQTDKYIKNEEQNKDELLDYVKLGDLKSQERFSNAIDGLETEKIIQVLKTIHEQQKKKRGISNQQVCCLSCVDTNNNHFLQSVCVGRIQPVHIEKPLFLISPKTPFWLQIAIEHIEP